ncbi:uncharacterized protein LOC135845969 [Planococcus citri]|uniref:uncharacterized protein LOC135845969 n=1 Tax=Planococcus citri TaxID=170843 RepID=UPI0031F78A31
MAECSSANVGTCLSSLFIMKHNCIDNLGHNVFTSDSNQLSSGECIDLEEKDYFGFVKLDPSDDTLDACKELQDSSDNTISSVESTLEDSDNYSSESSDRATTTDTSSDVSNVSVEELQNDFFVMLNKGGDNLRSYFFLNILPSVFKTPTIDSFSEDELDEDIAVTKEDYSPESVTTSEDNPSEDFCCKSKLQHEDSISNNNNLLCSSECLRSNDTFKNARLQEQQPSQLDITFKENIRFPTDKRSPLTDRICRWADCVDHVSSSAKLAEHLQTKHVNPQTFSETFICLWNGCKVFGRPSCSRTWLERHVLSHGGNKPYRCIVDNCGQRFSSRLVLERHVNQHFKAPKDQTDGVVDATPKLIRRNGQKLRYRRQPYSARGRTDAFDVGTMSKLQYLLVQMAQRGHDVSMDVLDSRTFLHITFQPKVIGCREEKNGEIKFLIRWYPYNALEDEWLPKSEMEKERKVPIWDLPASVQHLFWDAIFPNHRPKPVHQSRKCKPLNSIRDT